jgi:anti-repressor protein
MTPAKIEEILADPDTIIKLATALKEERAAKEQLQLEAAKNAPKVVFADAVAVSDGTILIGELAKILKGNNACFGQNRLFARLREDGYLIKRQGTDYNMPTQRSMELGLFKVKETAITHSDGHVTICKTTKVTGKGQQYFTNLYIGRNARDA